MWFQNVIIIYGFHYFDFQMVLACFTGFHCLEWKLSLFKPTCLPFSHCWVRSIKGSNLEPQIPQELKPAPQIIASLDSHKVCLPRYCVQPWNPNPVFACRSYDHSSLRLLKRFLLQNVDCTTLSRQFQCSFVVCGGCIIHLYSLVAAPTRSPKQRRIAPAQLRSRKMVGTSKFSDISVDFLKDNSTPQHYDFNLVSADKPWTTAEVSF